MTTGYPEGMVSQVLPLILILFCHLFSIEQISSLKINLKKINWCNAINKSATNCCYINASSGCVTIRKQIHSILSINFHQTYFDAQNMFKGKELTKYYKYNCLKLAHHAIPTEGFPKWTSTFGI